MQVTQQRSKKMYDKGYRTLVMFSDGTASIYTKPEMDEKHLPSQNILRYLFINEDGKLI